jgi:hypothetical protein
VDPGRVLAAAAQAAAQVLRGRDGWLATGADLLAGGAPIHILADASALGTAEQAALLFRECPRLVADATDAGDWLHVGIYTALPGYRAVLLAGTRYDAELVGTIHGRGGRASRSGRSSPPLPRSSPPDLAISLPGGAATGPADPRARRAARRPSLAAELWRRTQASDH